MTKEDSVGAKLKIIKNSCRDIITKRNKGDLASSVNKFLEKSAGVVVTHHSVYRVQSEDGIKRHINGFDELKEQLAKTVDALPGVFEKFIAWLASCFSSKKDVTHYYKAKIEDIRPSTVIASEPDNHPTEVKGNKH